jgi:hypothetical protein
VSRRINFSALKLVKVGGIFVGKGRIKSGFEDLMEE